MCKRIPVAADRKKKEPDVSVKSLIVAIRLKFTGKVGENLSGAAGGDRTHDPWLRRPILYPLSYSRIAEMFNKTDFRTDQNYQITQNHKRRVSITPAPPALIPQVSKASHRRAMSLYQWLFVDID
jgi:hypothetical protein